MVNVQQVDKHHDLFKKRSMWIRRYCYQTFTRHKPVQRLNNNQLSISFHASLSRRMGTHRYRKSINKSLASRFSSIDLELKIIIMLLVTFVNIAYLCISVLIHSYGVLLEAWGWFMPGKSLITIPSKPHPLFRVGSL